MRASGYSSRSSLYRGLFENGGKSPEQGAECEILDLYVSPASRGRGVAPALVCTVAAEILRRGGTYVKGQAVNNRAAQRLYARFAMCFPGADCIVGGRAFRQLAALAGHSARVAARSLPEKSWNYEP
jgi:ribosomal protein S18 acetylase RimI-like enzyme